MTSEEHGREPHNVPARQPKGLRRSGFRLGKVKLTRTHEEHVEEFSIAADLATEESQEATSGRTKRRLTFSTERIRRQNEPMSSVASVDRSAPRKFSSTDHLSPEAVAAFVDGELDPASHRRATMHLEECAQCQAEVDDQRDMSTVLKLWGNTQVEIRASESLRTELQELAHNAQAAVGPGIEGVVAAAPESFLDGVDAAYRSFRRVRDKLSEQAKKQDEERAQRKAGSAGADRAHPEAAPPAGGESH